MSFVMDIATEVSVSLDEVYHFADCAAFGEPGSRKNAFVHIKRDAEKGAAARYRPCPACAAERVERFWARQSAGADDTLKRRDPLWWWPPDDPA